MLKTNKLCRVCSAVKTNDVLLNAIYNTNYFLKTKGETLRSLANRYEGKFTYEGLLNHVKKHQFLSEDDFTKRHLAQIASQAEKSMLRRSIDAKQVWDEVIDQAMDRLHDGTMDVTTNHLLKAAKDKSDFEFKQKDQQLAMMEMVFHFASAEDKESGAYDRKFIEGQEVADYDPTQQLTAYPEPGEDGPSDVHNSPTGDAASSWTN